MARLDRARNEQLRRRLLGVVEAPAPTPDPTIGARSPGARSRDWPVREPTSDDFLRASLARIRGRDWKGAPQW